MTQNIRLTGWRDPLHPGTHKDGGLHEFRLKLSETPLSPWKRSFSELSRDQSPMASLDQDTLILSCELGQIESSVERIKQRLRTTNETVTRQEHEVNERVARQARLSEDLERKIIHAVENIRFEDQ